jgi:FtsH-binding integral membrane protein
MIISPTKKMVGATSVRVVLTQTEVLITGIIFSGAQKIVSASQAIIAVAGTMVFAARIIVAQADKMLSVAKKMLFVLPIGLRILSGPDLREPTRVPASRTL